MTFARFFELIPLKSTSISSSPAVWFRLRFGPSVHSKCGKVEEFSIVVALLWGKFG